MKRTIKKPPPTDIQKISSHKGIDLGYNPGGCQENNKVIKIKEQ
jgi:hypothetical protein